MKDEPPVISAIAKTELLCRKGESEKDIEVLHNFIAEAIVIELHPAIKLKAAEICKTGKLKLPDAIIAATAVVNELILITRNTSDFKNVVGLKCINPLDK